MIFHTIMDTLSLPLKNSVKEVAASKGKEGKKEAAKCF